MRMSLFNVPDLQSRLSRNQRLLGIDPGSRIIGIALSDVRLDIASPYGSIRRGKLRVNAEEIATIARKEEAGGMIIGLPLSMDGSFGPAAQAARDWAIALSDATGLPAALWDERETSSRVHQLLINSADLGRKRRAAVVDKMAAAVMLQSALDALPPISHAVSDHTQPP
ncbi:Endonuclease involved in recombination [Granulibacter bethesdensis]|nr:Endonuclease involved in recombination [Granulibacter bethesdensis]